MGKVTIPQHKDFPNEIIDIKSFLGDIDLFFSVSEWDICIEWCSGENSQSIEEKSNKRLVLSNSEFRRLYTGINQTIDGDFILKDNETVVATLSVFDSTYWEIESVNDSFISHIKKKYGEYVTP